MNALVAKNTTIFACLTTTQHLLLDSSNPHLGHAASRFQPFKTFSPSVLRTLSGDFEAFVRLLSMPLALP